MQSTVDLRARGAAEQGSLRDLVAERRQKPCPRMINKLQLVQRDTGLPVCEVSWEVDLMATAMSAETEQQFKSNRALIPVRGGPGEGAGHLCHFLLLYCNTKEKKFKAGKSLVLDREAFLVCHHQATPPAQP